MKVRFPACRAWLSCLPVLLFCHAATASPFPNFTCDVTDHPALARDGYLLGSRIYYGGEFVGLIGYPEENEKLPRVPSASGEKYSNGKITFHSKGKEGVLSIEGEDTSFPCVSTAAMATGQSVFGSIIRDKPDVSGKEITRLPKGELIEFTGETGSFHDGWQWVKVRFWEGQEGYVWGGTVCSKEVEISGVHFGCE